MLKLHNSPYVMNSFLSQFPELVTMKGGNVNDLCEAVGLPVENVIGRNQLIPFDKFIGLLEIAAQELDYPDIALGLARKQDVATLGPISRLLLTCTCFSDALNKIVQYLEILISGFTVVIKEHEHLLELVFDVNLPQLYHRQQFQNYLLAGTVVIMRGVLGANYPLRGCYFVREEPDVEQQKQHGRFFGCPVAFGADALRITVDKSILGEPMQAIPLSIPSTYDMAYTSTKTLENQLIDLVTMSLASGDTSINTVAGMMGYSPRTFRRRLQSASLSFSATLDAVRLSQANRYLQSTHYKLNDIAALLGYANQSAFTRSYIRWCGMTPSEYRQSLRRG